MVYLAIQQCHTTYLTVGLGRKPYFLYLLVRVGIKRRKMVRSAYCSYFAMVGQFKIGTVDQVPLVYLSTLSIHFGTNFSAKSNVSISEPKDCFGFTPSNSVSRLSDLS